MSIFSYIKQTWITLTRSNRNLSSAAADPKFKANQNGRWPVYVPAAEFQRVKTELSHVQPEDLKKVEILSLPEDYSTVTEPGLLYLPNSYVVPGGRFNEMYGWDSFFIEMGLLRDGELALAKNMADNCIYEILHYGKILNANRTYYLTRSQPPFLTEMLLAVYNRTHDRAWLEAAIPAIERYYRYWTSEPHLTPETKLSRYIDLGNGPAPEVLASERDKRGRSDYDLVRAYFRSHKIDDYNVADYYDRATDQLTPLFYQGDRAMRESGFDPSSRFGPFSVDIIHYNPVCLNSLLYLMEKQAAEILEDSGRASEAEVWKDRAKRRADQMNRLMWDTKDQMYYDYNFAHSRIRRYAFLTTFYPLWAGIARPDQAAGVVGNLSRFERDGGLQTSQTESGDQWDAPFGWAPLEWIAVEGMRNYGYREEADRVSMRFLKLVAREFSMYGTLQEKYDVVHGRVSVANSLRYGYRTNEAGFGWTNAVFTTLFDRLNAEDQHKVLAGR